LPLVNDWRALNVERQGSDPTSMLALYRDLIGLRRSEPALEVGEYVGLGANGSVLAYVRRSEGHSTFLVALNLGASPAECATDRIRVQGDIVLTTIGKRARERIAGRVRLAPHEGVIIRLES
jgi:alpha-glucosidase